MFLCSSENTYHIFESKIENQSLLDFYEPTDYYEDCPNTIYQDIGTLHTQTEIRKKLNDILADCSNIGNINNYSLNAFINGNLFLCDQIGTFNVTIHHQSDDHVMVHIRATDKSGDIFSAARLI